jgi:hypothetical protein
LKDIRGSRSWARRIEKPTQRARLKVTERRRGNCGVTVGAMGREGKVWVFSLC